jgi:hypothetical protein
MKLKLGTILTMAEVRHTDADVQKPVNTAAATRGRTTPDAQRGSR